MTRQKPDEATVIAADSGALSESWILFWFEGATGWEKWDAPWLVVLDHRPDHIAIGPEGLEIEATKGPGKIALMPLFGLEKRDTSGWRQAIPDDVVTRCRFWAGALRKIPVQCKEEFQIDPEAHAVVIRSVFSYVNIDDDWHTAPIGLAPLPPVLALELQSKRMPITLSKPALDLDLLTPHGPYMAVRDSESHEVSYKILNYITQTEEIAKPDLNNQIQKDAYERLLKQAKDIFSSGDGFFHQEFGDPKNFKSPPPQQSDGGNTCWAVMAAQYPCRALAYLPPDIVEAARPRLRRYFSDWVLQEARYKPFRGVLLLEGPGIGSWGTYGDAGKISANTLITIYWYAQNTGDWNLIRERWDLIKKLFVTPRECTWRGVGRDAIAEIGDEAAPALAMARLAWFVGDKDTFAYASYIFARELLHHGVKHSGADYFVKHQPLHSAEKIPENVYLTNIWGDIAGWQIDGPSFPEKTGERQYTNRWVRFGEPDVGRFHYDYYRDLAKKELDGLMLADSPWMVRNQKVGDAPHGTPSATRLRSLLLNETPDELSHWMPVSKKEGNGLCHALGFLRPGGPPKLKELIPAAETKTGWLLGLEREYDPTRSDDAPLLTAAVNWETAKKPRVSGEPALTWFGWRPPVADKSIPGGERWSFGQIQTDTASHAPKVDRISWLTQVIEFSAE